MSQRGSRQWAESPSLTHNMRLAPILLVSILLSTANAEAVVRYMHVLSEIQSRFATTDIVSEIENTSGNVTEVTYTAELPETAFVKSFYLERDGQISYGVIKKKEKAAAEYEEAKKKGKSAAHVRETNDHIFELSLSLAPYAKVGFNLTYQEVLYRTNYMYKHVINVKSSLPIKDLEVNILIADKNNFSTIHVPVFEQNIGALPTVELMRKTRDERVIMQAANDESGSIAYLSFDPRTKVENGQLVVLYNTTQPADSNEVQVVNGYFLHQYAPPEELEVANKTVIFVLDKSGSMKGSKLAQMKEAMMEILDEIAETDRTNILVFDRNVVQWRDEVTTLDAESKAEAKKFVNALEASGGTNIAVALDDALKMLAEAEKRQESFMPSVMILTDGQPTVGIKDHMEILTHLEILGLNYSINSISFGNDADYTLMKLLGGRVQPGGIARRIFESADATIQIAGFYNEIAYPLLKHIKVAYLDEQVDAASVISSGEQDYFFNGGDFFQIGRFSDTPTNVLNAEVEAESATGVEISKTEVKAAPACVDANLTDLLNGPKPKSFLLCGHEDPTIGNFIERMWAHMTIRKYEKLRDAQTKTPEEKANVAKMIENLSLKYGFVSSQTSMVVVLDENDNELSLEEKEFEDSILEDNASSDSASQLQGSELDSRFRTPFVASSLKYPADCRIHVVLLVDRVFKRRISALRLARLVSDFSTSLPSTATLSIGDISTNRSVIINGGHEDKLFSLVEVNKEVRQHLILLSEFASSLTRPLEYLRILAPAFQKISVAKTSGSLSTSDITQLRSLGRVNILKRADALDLAKTVSC